MTNVLPLKKKPRKTWEPVKGYPHLKLHTPTGIFYTRRFKAGRGALFKTTGERTVRAAQTRADEIWVEFVGRKPGDPPKRITIGELCDLVYARCLEDSKTLDENGHAIRRTQTLEHDRTFLLDKERVWKNEKGEIVNRRKYPALMKKLFGDVFADEIDEIWWNGRSGWCKRDGRRLGRKLGDIAKYMSLLLSYAHEEKYIGRKPEIVNPDKHVRKAVKITDEQSIAFFMAAEPELQDLIVINSENPLRGHESYQISWPMVKFTKEKGKTVVTYDLPYWFVKKNARKIRLTPNAAKVVIRRYREDQARLPRYRSQFVFPSPKDIKRPISRKTVNRMWHRMKERAGVDPSVTIHFNWFRHNVYRRLLKIHNVSHASVSQVGGTSIRTLQKHYEIEEEEAQLQVASAISLGFFSSGKTGGKLVKRGNKRATSSEEE